MAPPDGTAAAPGWTPPRSRSAAPAAAHRADIDGLRAVAVLPVLLFHAGIETFAGGFVGVDVFFVISGFLITRLIRQDLDAGRFSLLDFYERRTRRILPALFTVVAASFAAGVLLMLPADLEALARSGLATAAFVSNVHFAGAAHDYFAAEMELAPLLHTWSLAVEEQFYIVFPLLLIGAAPLAPRRLLWSVAGLSAASFALAAWLVRTDPAAAFYLAPARAWELGAGALLALAPAAAAGPRWRREGMAAAGLGLILWAVLAYDAATAFPGPAALAPVLGAVLVIRAAGAGPTLTGRALALPPVAGVGLVSYSLYLWHWPVLAFLRHERGTVELPAETALAALALAGVLAVLSWRFVEQPFRDRRRLGRGAVLGLSAGAGAGVGALALAVLASDGLPSRLPAAFRALGAEDARWRPCSGDQAGAPIFCTLGAADAAGPGVLFWGDSHAEALMPALDAALARAGVRGIAAASSGCAPLLGVARLDRPHCAAFARAMLAGLARRPGIGTVVLHARWALNETGARPLGERRPSLELAAEREAAPGDTAALFRAGLERTVRSILAGGRRVVLLGGVPEHGWHVPRRLAAHRRGWPLPPGQDADDVAARNAGVAAVFAGLAADPRVRVVPLADLFCAPGCRVVQDGRPLYRDGHHLTAHAARHIVAPALAAALGGG